MSCEWCGSKRHPTKGCPYPKGGGLLGATARDLCRQADEEKSPIFVLQHGSYRIDAPCPRCGADDGWRCYPGEWPSCWRCGVKVLRWGRTPAARCVTPNGRIDGHLSYSKGSGKVGETVCAFCGER